MEKEKEGCLSGWEMRRDKEQKCGNEEERERAKLKSFKEIASFFYQW